MKRLGIVAGVVLLVAALFLIPVIVRIQRNTRMVDAIDRMQQESLVEIRALLAQGGDITTRGHDNTVAMVAAFWNNPDLLKQVLPGVRDK